MRIIRPGSRGSDVLDVQQRLSALSFVIDPDELDGSFGPSTEDAVRTFQEARSIDVDGVVGPETWGHLVEAGYTIGDRTLYLRFPYFRGDDVRQLQRKLNALGFDAWREDGIFGEQVDRAVRDFQRNIGREIDGIVGPDTFEALNRLRPDPDAPSRALVRETESLRYGPSLDGAAIALDAGHGAGDPGAIGPAGSFEAEIAFDIAEALADELARRGGKPKVLRSRDGNPSAGDRAKAANALGAKACISVHLNDGDPVSDGATCIYFGSANTHSPAGKRLAEAIQGELSSRMGLAEGGCHAMATTLLRETRMPAIQVEPCFITNAREEALLAEPAFVRDIAVAIAIGLEGFLAPPAEDG